MMYYQKCSVALTYLNDETKDFFRRLQIEALLLRDSSLNPKPNGQNDFYSKRQKGA